VKRLALTALLLGVLASPAGAAGPPVRHVFIIVLENESASTTFGPHSPAPYLSKTLRAQGAYLPNYYGIGHESNDNYIAMISGQAPNLVTQADCPLYANLGPGTLGAYGQAQGLGCIYPAAVPTIAGQLQNAGLTWRDYNESMGADPAREPSECAHPGIGMLDNTQRATSTDEYATRHNPFVYFHSVIDDTSLCDGHVVGLDPLLRNLRTASETPNYVFITPDLCSDGHDSPCKNGDAGGLVQADSFLRRWVPRITHSPAFLEQNGLLMVLFDEAGTSDARSCCGEIAGPGSPLPGITGSGGGDTGAVLLSPCVAPGTVSRTSYNHYSMLRSVEDLFGLSHLGYAQLPGETSFGSDVFTRRCGPPPKARLRARAVGSSISLRWSARGAPIAYFTLQERGSRGHWRTLLRRTRRHSLELRARAGRRYRFRVRAVEPSGTYSPWVVIGQR
jgi:phosphatidylinositol-3-phosphatase